MKTSNNTILITGGSGGIGFELASQLLALGNTVIVTGRDQANLDSAKRKLPGLHTIRSDVGNAAEIAGLYRQVVEEFPRLNVLVNNAGVMRKINLHTFGPDLEDITQEIEINLNGTIRMVMQFLPHLKDQSHAAIVNVSSGLAFTPFPISPIYGASKAGVRAFTRALRIQLKHTNIQVFELAPPAIDTSLNDKFAEELKGSPVMEVAKLVTEAIKGIEKNQLEIRPGMANTLKIMSRLAPEFILGQLSKPVDQMLAETKG